MPKQTGCEGNFLQRVNRATLRSRATHRRNLSRMKWSVPVHRGHHKIPRTRNGRETEESRSWNMKNFKLLSLVGMTSIALANAGWAAGHGGGGGGGGGFGGGHAGGFAGGGFHGRGFTVGGHFAGGGVGNRGGGVGFGGMHAPGRVPSFEGAGPRFSSFEHPSHTQ